MTTKLTGVDQHLANHDKGLNFLHEGEMHLEKNLKMLIHKMGVTPSNTQPSEEREASMSTAINEMTIDDAHVDTELEREYDLTANEFDRVLDGCSRARPDAIPPPQKKNKSSASVSSERS